MKTVVFYYSGKGSNKYLAEKAAEKLECEAVELIPRAPGLVLPATLTGISFGIKPVKEDLSDYDRVVVCGPLYMGKMASPCTDFIRKSLKQIRILDVITCCGSTDEKKDDTFGYNLIFGKLKTRIGSKAGEFEAFPIELLLSEDKKDDSDAMMNTRLSDQTFNDTVKERLNTFIAKLTS